MHFISTCLSIFLAAAQLDIGQSFTRPTVHRQPPLPTRLHARGCAPYIPGGGGPLVTEIKSPDDLKDFIIADDRPTVIKVYANWCLTCKKFDLRYRKVANTWGEKHATTGVEESKFSNRVRFAQMEYGANEEMCELLDATRMPYILIFKREGGQMAGFTCPPSKVHLLVDALHKHAPLPPSDNHDMEIEESEVDTEQILAEETEFIRDYMPAAVAR